MQLPAGSIVIKQLLSSVPPRSRDSTSQPVSNTDGLSPPVAEWCTAEEKRSNRQSWSRAGFEDDELQAADNPSGRLPDPSDVPAG